MGLRNDQEKINLINSVLDRISRWKCALRKDKKLLNHKVLSESQLDYDKIKAFTENVVM